MHGLPSNASIKNINKCATTATTVIPVYKVIEAGGSMYVH